MIVLTAGEHFKFGVALEHAHHRESPAVDGQMFSQCVAAEGLLLQIGSDNTDRLPALHVHVADKAALGQLFAVHGVVGGGVVHDLADPVHASPVKLLVPVADHAAQVDVGGHAGEDVGVFVHQVIQLLRVGHHAVSHRPNLDLDHIDAHLVHLLLDHAGEAVAQGENHNHRPHADDDAQHGEQGPHFAGGEGFYRKAEGLSKVHAPTSSSSSSPWGWTTARGSRESPS